MQTKLLTMQICPECQTEQPAEAPFCTNCGFRIRRAETLREGVGAISDSMLAEYLQNGGQSGSKSKDSGGRSALRGSEPVMDAAVSAALRTTVGESFEPESVAFSSGLDAESEGQRTVVEGLKTVSAEDYGAGSERAVDHSAELRAHAVGALQVESSNRGSGKPGWSKNVPHREVVVDSRVQSPRFSTGERAQFGMLSGLWLGGTLLGLLLIFFIVDQRAGARSMGALPADVKASVDAASEKIHIEEGPFRSGLDEETRSFILQSCRRFYDDPDEQCEQDKLLPGEFPERTVELDGFYIDSKEVTNRQYAACVSAGKCEAIQYRECGVWTPQGLQISLRVPKTLQEPDVSVSCVTRAEATAYCGFVDGFLPSHNQWEKAARGPEGGVFPWGDSWASNLANWGELDVFRTSAVGKLDGFEWIAAPGHYPEGKSAYGLLDMAGNVSEWVQSDDPLVGYARGGSWISNPFELRSTVRLRIRAGDRRTDVGFRCAYE